MPLGRTDHTGKHAFRWTITCSQRCFNDGTPSTTLAQHLVSVAVLGLLLMTGALPRKYETLTQCCFNVGPTSETAGRIIVGHVSYTDNCLIIRQLFTAHTNASSLLMCHLYQCSSDQLSQNLKIWLRDATKIFILNTHGVR